MCAVDSYEMSSMYSTIFNEFRFGKPGHPQAAQLWYVFKRMIGEDNAS